MERIDKVAPYQSAFDYLAKFYNRKAGRPKLIGTDSHEIDMTADSDDEALANVNHALPADSEAVGENEDSMGLAAGLPGKDLSILGDS